MYIFFCKKTYKRIAFIVFFFKIIYLNISKIKADISINMFFYPIYAFFFRHTFILFNHPSSLSIPS